VLDRIARQLESDVEIKPDHRERPDESGDTALAIGVQLGCDAIGLGVLLLRLLKLAEDP
jgi:hypothetical protein